MEKLMKLVKVATVVLEMYAVKLKNEMSGANAPAETEIERGERKLKKTRAAKIEPITVPPVVGLPTAPAAPAVEDQLGLGEAPAAPVEVKKELTEKESTVKMEEVTKRFVTLHKNDKPEDGKTRAIKMMQTDPRFKVGKLGDLTHAQRLLWIAEMEK